jgi:hypothetical protein
MGSKKSKDSKKTGKAGGTNAPEPKAPSMKELSSKGLTYLLEDTNNLGVSDVQIPVN